MLFRSLTHYHSLYIIQTSHRLLLHHSLCITALHHSLCITTLYHGTTSQPLHHRLLLHHSLSVIALHHSLCITTLRHSLASQHYITASASQTIAIEPIILYNIQTMPNNTPPKLKHLAQKVRKLLLQLVQILPSSILSTFLLPLN